MHMHYYYEDGLNAEGQYVLIAVDFTPTFPHLPPLRLERGTGGGVKLLMQRADGTGDWSCICDHAEKENGLFNRYSPKERKALERALRLLALPRDAGAELRRAAEFGEPVLAAVHRYASRKEAIWAMPNGVYSMIPGPLHGPTPRPQT